MFRMYSLRKWLYKPKKSDSNLLAQFFYADEDLNVIATELDSFDGRKDPERCTALVNQLRACQDKVLNIVQMIMDDAIPNRRANRDFRVKFPDDVVHENLSGQLWFGAECLAAGSSIMNHEVESASMRPLARALTRTLDNLRSMLRDQCLRNSSLYTEKIKDALIMFDQLFAEFELSYVSAMVPVKSMKEYDTMQDVIVLFSETVDRAVKQNLISQEMIDDCDPALMFTIPRLAIVCGLLIFGEGPLNPDNESASLTEMFRPFQTLLYKIRQLLITLSEEELKMLEKALCSAHQPEVQVSSPGKVLQGSSEEVCDIKHKQCTADEEDSDAYSGHMSQSTSANTIIGNPEFVCEGTAMWTPGMKHQDSRDSGICDQRAVSHESLPPNDLTSSAKHGSMDSLEQGDICSNSMDSCLSLPSEPRPDNGSGFSPDCNRISPIEELMSESYGSQGSGSFDRDGDLTNGDSDKNEIPVCVKHDVSQTETISDCLGEGGAVGNTNKEILIECESVSAAETMDLSCDSLNLPKSNSDDRLLHVEDAASSTSICGSATTSPSKSIYSASESDTYFDASEMPSAGCEDNHTAVGDVAQAKAEDTCINCNSPNFKDNASDADELNCTERHATPVELDMDVNHFENNKPKDAEHQESGVAQKMKTAKGSGNLLKSSKENFYHKRVRDLVGRRREEHGKYQESMTGSSCSTCASDSDWDRESCDSSDTSSYNSDCHDDEEIALAIQAAEFASRNEARSRFRSSSDLIHRLFVCVSGVADQLQTNYASDLRNILRGVFEIHSSEPIIKSDQPGKRTAATIRRGPVQALEPPTWVPDEESPHCSSCKMIFTLVRRRHHCRNCGKIFCSRCSANFVPLPHFGHTKPVRVCNRCFMFQVTPFTVNETS